MAASGVVGRGSASGSWAQFRDSSRAVKKGFRVSCVSSGVMDSYRTLKVQPGASESEVKKAFRQLALKYHPDVCRGSNCGVQFHQINEAYDVVISNLRGELPVQMQMDMYNDEEWGGDEVMRGMHNEDWDLWEEWMGWEGAGIRDYASHINPYI